MNTIVISVLFLLLFIIVLTEFLLIIMLARQVGRLVQRFGGESGALATSMGPSIGSKLPFSKVTPMNSPLKLIEGTPSLMVFTQTSCPICDKLIKSIQTLATGEKDINIYVIARGENQTKHYNNWNALKRRNLFYCVDEEAFKLSNIDGVPYAVLIDENLEVLSKGLVNNLAHLESLLNSNGEEQPIDGRGVISV